MRKDTTKATSPRLLAYRGCIASEMSGKDFANIAAVQAAFIANATKCQKEAAGKPTILKK